MNFVDPFHDLAGWRFVGACQLFYAGNMNILKRLRLYGSINRPYFHQLDLRLARRQLIHCRYLTNILHLPKNGGWLRIFYYLA